MLDQSGEAIPQYRPDVLGATIAIDDDGIVTETVCFTSEAAARQAERKLLPAELREVIEEELALLEEVQYLALHSPWFAFARRT